MSEYERARGTVTRLGFKIPIGTREEQIKYLTGKGFYFEDEDYCEDLIEIDGGWWNITRVDSPPEGHCYGEFTGPGNTQFTYDCHWYNGGCSFHEALEDAYKDANKR